MSRAGTIVYSEGLNLTLVKGKDPETVAAELIGAQESGASFFQLTTGGTLSQAGAVWVKPDSVNALIEYDPSS